MVKQTEEFSVICYAMSLIRCPCNVYTSMGQSKKDVTQLLTHWSYVFLALTDQHIPQDYVTDTSNCPSTGEATLKIWVEVAHEV